MKHYFVDTNVVIDMLADRDGFADAACAIFDAAERKEIKLSICALSYSNIYYVVRREIGHQKTIDSLLTLSSCVSILGVDAMVIEKALNSDFNDYEDAIQYYSALQDPTIEGIITRNPKDFKSSEIKILLPTEFL